jgi:hypothetical protein
VDVEAIIERDLGAVIDYTSLDWPPILGSISRRVSDGRYVIVVKEQLADQYPARYRFTLAQEVGHMLLHGDLLGQVRTPEEAEEFHLTLSPEQYRRLESDANWCAGAILLPQQPFREAVHEAYGAWFGKIAQVARVVPEDLLRRVIHNLARLFRVSPDVARIRIERYPFNLDTHIISSAKRQQPFISEG